MLALAPTSDAQMFTLIVTNHGTYPAPPKKCHVTLPADATLQQLHEKIAEECQFVPGTFELRHSEKIHRLTDDGASEKTIFEVGVSHKARLALHGVNGNMPLSSGGDNSSTAAAALGTVALWNSSRGEHSAYYGPLNKGGTSSSPAGPNADGYVGLVNQGATCYLSSLVQSLYMTPEFRRALYDAGAAAAAAAAASAAAAAAPFCGRFKVSSSRCRLRAPTRSTPRTSRVRSGGRPRTRSHNTTFRSCSVCSLTLSRASWS